MSWLDPHEWWVTVETQVSCPSCGEKSPGIHSVGQAQDWMKEHRQWHLAGRPER